MFYQYTCRCKILHDRYSHFRKCQVGSVETLRTLEEFSSLAARVPPSPSSGATHFSKYACTHSASHLPDSPCERGCPLEVVQLSNQVAMTLSAGGVVWEKRACNTFARVPFPQSPASSTSGHALSMAFDGFQGCSSIATILRKCAHFRGFHMAPINFELEINLNLAILYHKNKMN